MVEIKCKSCHTWNTDTDYCKQCNAVISMEEEARIEDEIQAELIRNKPDSKLDVFIKKWKKHPNIFLKGFFYIFYSVYLVMAAIGTFMAWLTLMSQA